MAAHRRRRISPRFPRNGMSTDTLDPSFAPPPMGPYRYKPFPDKNSFRLLRLFPPKGDGGIECSIEIAEAPFNQAPVSYEAISYVWGDPQNKVDIVCDGHTMAITSSLADVLRRVRLATSTRVLWADGICINQEDVQERIGQVQIMALIYVRARRVLAWIGWDAGAETASRLIKKLRLQFEAALEEKDELHLCDVIDARDQADLECVVRMFRKPLFGRVWIIQELGVAPAITFLYGDFEIDWIDLVYFANCMSGSQDLYQLEHYTDYEKFLLAFSSFRPSFYEERKPPEFLDILVMARNYGASDPRDHVFALLGHDSVYSDGSPLIRADYTKPLSHIFRQLTFQLILHSKSLRPLSAVHHEKLNSNKDFPSWVPALHETSIVTPFGIPEKYYYNADSANTDATMFVDNSEGLLTVRGLVFDTLSSVSSMWFPDGTAATDPLMMQAFKEAFARSQSQTHSAYEPAKRLEAFGITMTAGLLEHTAAEDDIATHRANFCAYLIKVHDKQPNTRQKLALTQDDRLVADIQKEAVDGNEYHFVRDANVTWGGRKFFCTSRGYFGLGPRVLKRDDLCCILFGARVPFILRKAKNHYLLIGECYVHGIMRGEAVNMWQNGDLQEQEFELC